MSYIIASSYDGVMWFLSALLLGVIILVALVVAAFVIAAREDREKKAKQSRGFEVLKK